VWIARAPGGEFVYANHEFQLIMGMAPRDDVGVGAYSEPYGIFTRDGAPYPEDRLPFVRALAERRVVVVDDLRIHRRDGTRVDVRAFARPVIGVAGAISHVVIAFFDITREVEAERARAESEHRLELAQRMEAIGTLAGGIAHDFNNLILGIKLLAAQLAIDEPDLGRRGVLHMIDDVTERAAALSKSLLGFARRGKHRAAPVVLASVVESMVDMLRRTVSGVDIGVELLAPREATVIGDQSQLEQVIMNLVVNARDALASQDGGRVVIRTRDVSTAAGRRIALEVADNGPGIPPEIRDRVFEPYFTTKDQGPAHGTGLGLATVFGIVESHGGAVEVEAGLDGRGTTVRVLLPAGADAVAAAPEQVLHEHAATGTGTILVVDDDDTVRAALDMALTTLGYEVILAANGAEAIELFDRRRAKIRAVVLDMVMPGMGGRATYLALRERRADLPVVLISGYAMNEEVQAILDLGVRRFIQKPCSIDDLGHALAASIAGD
jgi:PAS domain S-box-containing protein